MQNGTKRKRGWLTIGASTAAIILGLIASDARASSTVPMTMDRMADHAGQVIVGEVASVESHWAENPRRIESTVEFRAVRYLKGETRTSRDTFTLTVPGGRVGDTQMRMCCAPEFTVGDEHVLFLLPEYKTYPVVGLSQGAFRVRTDERGVKRVYQEGVLPVVGLNAEGYVRVAGTRRHAPLPTAMTGGVVRTASEPVAAQGVEGMNLDRFIEMIQPILNRSRAHVLPNGQAGNRVLVELRPTSLKRSPRDLQEEEPELQPQVPTAVEEKKTKGDRRAAQRPEDARKGADR